ncbi:ead/Ea22-like family protein [Salmonella enterica subsp. enterica serovar Worthington]|nr:ead/Ea22-like family protein [Salmonella enterica subsp. enterica serovar Worthington]
MNPVSCKLLNEAWEKEFPDEVAIAERMLALLDELEHYKSREERVTKLVLDNSTSWDALYKKLEAAEKRIAEHNFENRLLANADRDIKALRQRIAELESNEIREDGNQFLVVRHPGKTPVIKHWSGDPEEFLRNLIEQDPLVTIDIITHRYYGVGGQWVQDADEYLHMMAAAGIGKGD